MDTLALPSPSSRLRAAVVLVALSCAACAGEKVCDEGGGVGLCDPSHINTRGWEDSPFMSADGTKLYFMYSTYNFMPIFRLGLPERRGPQRDGYVKQDNPFDEAAVYVATRTADGWSAPEWLALNAFGTTCCLMTNDARSFYFQRGGDGSQDLAEAHIDENGDAQAPQPMGAASSDGLEDNPHVSADDATVWFTSDRPGGSGGKDIWQAERDTDGAWGPAHNVTALNTADDEDQIWVRNDGAVAYFNRGTTMFRVEREGSDWGVAEPLRFDGEAMEGAEPSLTDDESLLVFARVDRELDDIVIVQSERNADGSFAAPVPVD